MRGIIDLETRRVQTRRIAGSKPAKAVRTVLVFDVGLLLAEVTYANGSVALFRVNLDGTHYEFIRTLNHSNAIH